MKKIITNKYKILIYLQIAFFTILFANPIISKTFKLYNNTKYNFTIYYYTLDNKTNYQYENIETRNNYSIEKLYKVISIYKDNDISVSISDINKLNKKINNKKDVNINVNEKKETITQKTKKIFGNLFTKHTTVNKLEIEFL